MSLLPTSNKHSILEWVTQIAFKSKSTTIITSSSEKHPECVCQTEQQRGDYFPLASGIFSLSVYLLISKSFEDLRSFSSNYAISNQSHQGHGCQHLEDEDVWLPLSSSLAFLDPPLVCSVASPCRILFDAVGLGKFSSGVGSSGCSVSLLQFQWP